MNKVLLLILFLVTSAVVYGQSNYEKFKELFKDNDTSGVQKLLIEWEQSRTKDAEFYTSAFNFYYTQSKEEVVLIDQQQKKNQSFQLTDSTGKVVGYISSNPAFNEGKLSLAFKYINEGIARFPNRLDLRFGKCYVLGQIGDYDNFTSEIIKAVEYSPSINNVWTWTENKKLEKGEQFMLETVQEYLKQLYDTENDSLLEDMKRIGEITIKHYPNNIEILSTTAVANTLTKNYGKALEYLKQAEKINPKDFIVLNNLAQVYKQTGDKVSAIKYFELVEKYGDEEAKQQARRNINELRH